jgi:hypothetical protein
MIYKYTVKYKDDVDFSVYDTVNYFIRADIENTFPEIKLELQVHSFDDNSFFFIASLEEQERMFNTMSITKDSDAIMDFCGGFHILSEDVTGEVLNNIDKYDNIENFVDRNTLVEFYHKVFDKDSVLDKILEMGVNSLNKYDKNILSKI